MEYTILEVTKGNDWSSGHSGAINDMQGYNLVLKGVSEPVLMNKKIPVVQEPKAGDVLFGAVTTAVNRKGSSYNKFTSQPRPDGTPAPYKSEASTIASTVNAPAVDWDKKDLTIRAQWAIGQSVSIVNSATAATKGGGDLSDLNEKIEGIAIVLFAMVDRVRESNKPIPQTNAQVIDNLGNMDIQEEPISMEDIPF